MDRKSTQEGCSSTYQGSLSILTIHMVYISNLIQLQGSETEITQILAQWKPETFFW